MAQANFLAWSGLTNALVAPLSGIAITTTPKTILQIQAPANSALAVKEYGYTFLGASLPTVPIILELLDTGTAAATVTQGNVANWNAPNGAGSQVQYGNVQIVALGAPTAGTFTLTFNGQTTAAIAFNAAASAVQTALQALSGIGSNVTVAGSGPYTITFAGLLAAIQQPPIAITSSLTGGTPVVSGQQTGFNASAEGTITSTRLLAMRGYPADWAEQYPLSDEPAVAAGKILRLRASCGSGTATIAGNVRYVEAA